MRKDMSQSEKEAWAAEQIRRIRAHEQDPTAIGRLGGLSKSPAKQRAARRNGRLGGRPRVP